MKLSCVMIPVSTIDWYGRSVSVIFFNGCDFKCLYCSNNELIRRVNSLQPYLREKKEKRIKKNKYLFNWDNIPGIDNKKLIEFLKQHFGINWVKTAIIEKIDDNKTIIIFSEKNFLSLKLNDRITKVIITIDDDRNDELTLKMKTGRLKVYKSRTQINVISNPLTPTFMKEKVFDIEEVEKQILESKMFISAVVFSGGEPTKQYEVLERLARFAKDHGLLVGIETNGYYPERLSRLIEKKLLDKIFLDIKAPLNDAQNYSTVTGGIKDAAERARQSLNLTNVPIEVRTTVFRSLADIPGIAKSLEGHDCTYVLQQGIPENAPDGKIQKEKPLSRDEMIALAQSASFLKDVRIRTREKGEERVSPRI